MIYSLFLSLFFPEVSVRSLKGNSPTHGRNSEKIDSRYKLISLAHTNIPFERAWVWFRMKLSWVFSHQLELTSKSFVGMCFAILRMNIWHVVLIIDFVPFSYLVVVVDFHESYHLRMDKKFIMIFTINLVVTKVIVK